MSEYLTQRAGYYPGARRYSPSTGASLPPRLAFRCQWRIATRAPGGATDAETKGGDIEKVRQAIGYARPDTTRIYQRAEAAATAEIAVLRFGKKGRTKDSN